MSISLRSIEFPHENVVQDPLMAGVLSRNHSKPIYMRVRDWVSWIPNPLNGWNPKTFQILKNQKKGVETYWRLNLSKRSFFFFPSIERAHFISDPHLIKKILHAERNGQLMLVGFSEFVEPLTGKENMLLCPSNEHRRLRSPLEHALSARVLSGKRSEEIAKVSLDYLEDFAIMGRSHFAMPPLAFRIVSRLALGLNDDDIPSLMSYVLNISFNDVKDTLIKKIKEIFDQRRYDDRKGMASLQFDFQNNRITEEEKISSAITILVAGVHTTSVFLTLFIKTMQNQPSYRQKILEEWQDFIQAYGPSLKGKECFSKAISLFACGGEAKGVKFEGSKWLERCFMECLRLYPIFPDIKRIAGQSGAIDSLFFWKGDEIRLNIFATQRDEKIWGEDAALFRPERFEGKKEKTQIFNFGLGSQSCIGKHLLHQDALIIIAELIVLFTWQNSDASVDFAYDGFGLTVARTVFTEDDFCTKLEARYYMLE